MVLELAPSAKQDSDAFFLKRGHCFRIIKSEALPSTHCDGDVVWKGPWRDVNGEIWVVEACEIHKPHQDDESKLSGS